MSKLINFLCGNLSRTMLILKIMGLPPSTYNQQEKYFKKSNLRKMYTIIFLCVINFCIYLKTQEVVVTAVGFRVKAQGAHIATFSFMTFANVCVIGIHIYHLIYSQKFQELFCYFKNTLSEVQKKILIFDGTKELNDSNINLKEIYVINYTIIFISVMFVINTLFVMTFMINYNIYYAVFVAAITIIPLMEIASIVTTLISCQSIILYYYIKINHHLKRTMKKLDLIEPRKKNVLEHLSMSDDIDILASIYKDLSDCTKKFVNYFAVHMLMGLSDCFLNTFIGVFERNFHVIFNKIFTF